MREKTIIGVVGLGYVGLPLAIAFARAGFEVQGFDVSKRKIKQLQKGIDATGELKPSDLRQTTLHYSTNPQVLSLTNFIIVAVPTPVADDHTPDLSLVRSASETVGKYLTKGTIVVYESTVYPGVTEEICIPILEEQSRLKAGRDFKIGYSPERINPGDQEHTLQTVVKVVSGMDASSLEKIAVTYRRVCPAGVFRAASIKVAEAEKIIENIQRDVNIALINELAMIFDQLGINTHDVLEAAKTKWNFHAYTPGLVGGHCIGVDPYYLVHQAESRSLSANLIATSRKINDGMAEYVALRVIRTLIELGHTIQGSRVLVAGLTFKENVRDFRNSKAAEIITTLEKHGVHVEAYDPYYDPEEIHESFSGEIVTRPQGPYQAMIFPVFHQEFATYFTQDRIRELTTTQSLIFDVKGGMHLVPSHQRTYQRL